MNTITLPEVKFFYGFPSDEHLETLKFWMIEDVQRHLVFIEDDLSIYLENRSLLDHPQMHVYFVANLKEDLWKIAVEYSFYQKELVETFSNHKSSTQITAFFQSLKEIIEAADVASSIYKDFGVSCLKNSLKNFPTLERAVSLNMLKDVCKGVPALICGSGESLSEHIDLIKKLGSKVLIFAGGSTLPLLQRHGITPDFSGAIDPGPIDQSLCVFPKVPFFYQTQVDPKWFDRRSGPLVWVADSGHFLIEKWLCEQQNVDYSVFDGGWTVGTFLAAIATFLGCDPILFLGMDFCTKSKKLDESWISVKNEDGQSCFTKRDWQLAAKWMEEWIQCRPERKWQNLGQGLNIGALKTAVVPNLPDITATKQRLSNLFPNIAKVLQKKELLLTVDGIKSSFHKVLELTQKMIKDLEASYPNIPEGKLVLYEIELEEQVAYTHFIQINIKIWEPLWRQQIDGAIPEVFGLQLYKWLWMQRLCFSVLEEVL